MVKGMGGAMDLVSAAGTKGQLIPKDIFKSSKNKRKNSSKLTYTVLGQFCANFYAYFWKIDNKKISFEIN